MSKKIDAGGKGILMSFHNNTFAAPDKLIEFVTKQFGAVKIRPDQKLFIEKILRIMLCASIRLKLICVSLSACWE